jgi:predicted DNA-binding transcriptional regulator YafY
VALTDVAERLGVTRERVRDDLVEVTAREYYHPAGGADDIQIYLERDRVRVFTGDELTRPVRLAPREALVLHLGLRVLAADCDPVRRADLLLLAGRLERQLAVAPKDAFEPRYTLDEGDAASDGIRAFLQTAARDRRRCRIRYLKPGEPPRDRGICPYALLFGSGRWYVVGRCEEGEAVRVFRVDRVLEVAPADGTFEVPDDFDPNEYVTDAGRVYRAEDEIEAEVRFAPELARRAAERGPVRYEADGAALASLRLADAQWLLRRVLEQGPGAEILRPAELRKWMSGVVRERLSA